MLKKVAKILKTFSLLTSIIRPPKMEKLSKRDMLGDSLLPFPELILSVRPKLRILDSMVTGAMLIAKANLTMDITDQCFSRVGDRNSGFLLAKINGKELTPQPLPLDTRK